MADAYPQCITGFLQNQWFHDPVYVRSLDERRRRHIWMYAFMRSATGRALCRSLGEERVRSIQWDEASPQLGSTSDSKFPADHNHIKTVLTVNKPCLVLSFGKIANEALPLCWPGELIPCCHPAKRGSDTPVELRKMAERVIEFSKNHHCQRS